MENKENNIQNQEEKIKKGLSVPVVVIILSIVLVIGIVGGFLLSENDNIFNKKETQLNSNNNNKFQSQTAFNTDNNIEEDSEEENTAKQSVNKEKNAVITDKDNKETTFNTDNNIEDDGEEKNTAKSSVNKENKETQKTTEYAKYYIDKIKELNYVDDSTKYGLLSIDKSDIPYLIVDTGEDLSIYKFNKNTVVGLKERDSYGTHGRDGYDYIEGKNIMRDYCTFEEGYIYEIYDELFNLEYSVECTFDGQYKYTDKSGEKKVITEEEFNKLSYKNSTFKHLREITNKDEEEIIKFLEGDMKTTSNIEDTTNNTVVTNKENKETQKTTEYAKYYIDKIKELNYVDDSTKYGLLSIDKSDIPYLIVDTGEDLSIYKFNKNTVVGLKERDSYGTHGRDGYDYIEGKNIMRDYCTFEEGYIYEIYDELFNLEYSVECTFDGQYKYTDKSGEKKVITEEEFNKLSYKNSTFKHLREIANKNKEEIIKSLEN